MSAAIMEWKLEPASPLLDAERDAWLFFEDDATAIKGDDLEQSGDTPLTSPSASPTRAEVAQQLLDDIEDFVKKENNESFSNWFEEKVNLPIFDEIPTILPTDEFNKERSYEGFGYPQLTPPQSPPGKALTPTYEETSGFILPDENVQITFAPVPVYAAGILQTQNVVVQPTYITLLPPDNVPEPQRKMAVDESYLTAPPTPIPDIEKEMAVLDEVVRDTAENLAPNWDQFESESFHSDASSESFACSSPRSESASATSAEDEAEEETDDPEWQPEETVSRPRKALKTTSKRSKPYSRSANVEDKRLRKKEQNKNAATRYRMKKKAEVSEILEEEKQLEDKNAELEKRVGDITTEIKYLKGLMRELFKAKGLIE